MARDSWPSGTKTRQLLPSSSMVEEGRDCSEVLIQLAAVRSALNSTARVILKDHLEHCIADAVATGDLDEIELLNDAIDKYID